MADTLAPTMGRPKKTEATTHLRAYESTALKVGIIARVHGIDTADALRDILGAAIEREYGKAVDVLNQKRAKKTDKEAS